MRQNTRNYLTGFLLIILTFSGIFISGCNDTDVVDQATDFIIEMPIPHLEAAATVYKLDPSKPASFTYSSGTVINIPENAFVDVDGNIITDEVTLEYKEYRNPMEIYLSGIPMNYDSAGSSYTFESAGMFEINGSSNGKPVFVADGQNIDIDLANAGDEGAYNFYNLDETTGNWNVAQADERPITRIEDMGAPIPTENEVVDPDTELRPFDFDAALRMYGPFKKLLSENSFLHGQLKQAKEDGNTELPIEPQLLREDYYQFDLDYKDVANINDFEKLEGLRFEVNPFKEKLTPELAVAKWDKISLDRVAKGNYFLIFEKGEERLRVKAKAVYTKSSYRTAMEWYKMKQEGNEPLIEELEAKIKAKEQEIGEMQAAHRAEPAELMELWTKSERLRANLNRQRVSDPASTQYNYALENAVKRRFAINDFGIWNCDRPAVLPQGAQLAATFADENGNELALGAVKLVEKGRNALFTYYPSFYGEFKMNPSAENIIWAITSSGQLAVCSGTSIEKVSASTKNFTFKMKLYNVKELDKSQLTDILGV